MSKEIDMKKLVLMMVLVLTLGASAWGADSFNGTSSYVTLADNAALTFPDADWSIAGKVKFAAYPTTVSARLVAWGTAGATTNTFEFYVTGTGQSPPNQLNITAFDADGTTWDHGDDSTHFTTENTSWSVVAAVRSGNTITVYFNGTSVISFTDAAFDAIDASTSFYFGARSDLARFLNGREAEWAKWDRALTAGEITSLSKDFAPNCFLNGLKWYVPMIRDAVELKAGLTVTNTNITIVDHPRMIYCGQ